MSIINRTLFVTVALLPGLIAACGGGESGFPVATDPPEWFSPDCATVTGAPVATWSPDQGASFRPNAEPVPAHRSSETFFLAAAYDFGGLLFAQYSRDIYMSTDAGCHWELAASDPSGGYRGLVAGSQTGYSVGSNQDELVRIAPDSTVETFPLPFQANELATTPDDPDALYALSEADAIWRSGDQGETWVRQGKQLTEVDFVNGFAINPNDSLHFIVSGGGGSGSGEVAISFDGGNSWMLSTGLMKDASGATQAIRFGGDDATTDIWVTGTRQYIEGSEVVETEFFMARSVDGGLTFSDAVVSGPDVEINSAMAPRPNVAGEVYFPGRGCPFKEPVLFHYRASDDTVTTIPYSSDETLGFRSLLFHPTDPDVLYLGHRAIGSC